MHLHDSSQDVLITLNHIKLYYISPLLFHSITYSIEPGLKNKTNPLCSCQQQQACMLHINERIPQIDQVSGVLKLPPEFDALSCLSWCVLRILVCETSWSYTLLWFCLMEAVKEWHFTGGWVVLTQNVSIYPLSSCQDAVF